MKIKWARQALISWAVSTSVPFRHDENVLQTSSNLLHFNERFRGGTNGNARGMLTMKFPMLVCAVCMPLLKFFQSFWKLLPILSRPCLTLTISLIGPESGPDDVR
mmetsp:Transcript_18642/g.26542  ORF Transcript_18642/g.26542 Transcript_18642/m.26542 type:complete len:105 (-) Transcript_18642:396-710(-)